MRKNPYPGFHVSDRARARRVGRAWAVPGRGQEQEEWPAKKIYIFIWRWLLAWQLGGVIGELVGRTFSFLCFFLSSGKVDR